MEAILLSIPLDQETRFTPSRKFFRTQGCYVKLLQGWILDLYPNQRGMTRWLIDRNQSHYHLSDSFAPAFYVTRPEDQLIRLQDAAQRKTTELRTRLTERTGLGLNAARQVLAVSVLPFQHIDDPSYKNDPEDQLRPKTGRFCLRGGVGARSHHRQESCNRTSKERLLLGC